MGFLGFFGRKSGQPAAAAAAGPTDADAAALIDRGNQFEDTGDLESARKCYEDAVALAPGLARAHLNLGNVMLAARQHESAAMAYRAALDLNPDYAPAHYNLGNASSRLGKPADAMACYLRAVALKPDFTDAHVALGNVQEDLRLLDDAEASYRRALQLQPDYSQVHNNLAVVLSGQKRWTQALEAFRNAARGHYAPAVAGGCFCASQLCDWQGRAAEEQSVADMIVRGVGGISPFPILGMNLPPHNAALLLRQAGMNYAQDRLARASAPTRAGARKKSVDGRLRIGYLSSDFHDHATMHLLGGVLAAHDRKRFAIHAYSHGRVSDDVTLQARASCECFTDVKDLSDPEAAAAIAADGIDILVDLKGYTEGGRLEIAALRPAPVVASWLGYPGTLGHPLLADYLVGDPIVTPPASAANFSETLALMPHCYQPNDRARAVGPSPGRAAAGLPAEGFVFCSFNQSYKFNPESFGAWCRLLCDVPDSVLWLLSAPDAAMDNLGREARARGVNPSRLIFAPRLPLAEHLGRLQLADLALDTFPCNSHTTASDALWVGVPLVTLVGSTFASRVAASLLAAAGVPELTAHGWDEYVELARAFALEPQRLQSVRKRLLDNRLSCPLFDTDRFARNLERLYLRMWEQHQGGRRETIELQDSIE